MSPQEAYALAQEGHPLVDVRSVAEYEAGHPPGAWNIPWIHMDRGESEVNSRFFELFEHCFPDRRAKIILFCQSGRRSHEAAMALRARGYEALFEMPAGWGGRRDAFGRLIERGWEAEGLPIERGPSERGWSKILLRKDHGLAAEEADKEAEKRH
ncbi:MAG: rhodanese-like domain-containing protein [Sandaracinaceae bacterium]|nr:rhodanese-like domain-containing protein [Sandaracinaceae bacterium]